METDDVVEFNENQGDSSSTKSNSNSSSTTTRGRVIGSGGVVDSSASNSGLNASSSSDASSSSASDEIDVQDNEVIVDIQRERTVHTTQNVVKVTQIQQPTTEVKNVQYTQNINIKQTDTTITKKNVTGIYTGGKSQIKMNVIDKYNTRASVSQAAAKGFSNVAGIVPGFVGGNIRGRIAQHFKDKREIAYDKNLGVSVDIGGDKFGIAEVRFQFKSKDTYMDDKAIWRTDVNTEALMGAVELYFAMSTEDDVSAKKIKALMDTYSKPTTILIHLFVKVSVTSNQDVFTIKLEFCNLSQFEILPGTLANTLNVGRSGDSVSTNLYEKSNAAVMVGKFIYEFQDYIFEAVKDTNGVVGANPYSISLF